MKVADLIPQWEQTIEMYRAQLALMEQPDTRMPLASEIIRKWITELKELIKAHRDGQF